MDIPIHLAACKLCGFWSAFAFDVVGTRPGDGMPDSVPRTGVCWLNGRPTIDTDADHSCSRFRAAPADSPKGE